LTGADVSAPDFGVAVSVKDPIEKHTTPPTSTRSACG
jgi:hypothetical protein